MSGMSPPAPVLSPSSYNTPEHLFSVAGLTEERDVHVPTVKSCLFPCTPDSTPASPIYGVQSPQLAVMKPRDSRCRSLPPSLESPPPKRANIVVEFHDLPTEVLNALVEIEAAFTAKLNADINQSAPTAMAVDRVSGNVGDTAELSSDKADKHGNTLGNTEDADSWQPAKHEVTHLQFNLSSNIHVGASFY